MQVSVELKLKSEGHDDDIAQVTVREAAAKLGVSEWGEDACRERPGAGRIEGCCQVANARPCLNIIGAARADGRWASSGCK